jgi:hypothetical protein
MIPRMLRWKFVAEQFVVIQLRRYENVSQSIIIMNNNVSTVVFILSINGYIIAY